jgi:hypothetical protein
MRGMNLAHFRANVADDSRLPLRFADPSHNHMHLEVNMRQTPALLVMAALLCTACGSSSMTSPSTPSPTATPTPTPTPAPTNFTGTWNGTVTDSLCGAGTFQGVLTQSGSSVTGTGTVGFARIACGGVKGSFSGTASGASLQATLQSNDPQYCSLALTATLSGSTLTGTYAAVSCAYTETGTISATQQ